MATIWSWSSAADTDFDLFVGTAPTVGGGGSYGDRKVWAAATTVAYGRKAVTALGDHGLRFIYTVAAYAGSSHMVAGGMTDGTTFQWRVDLSSAGLLRIRDAGLVQVAQGTVNLAAAVEHRFEIYRAGTTLTVKAYRVSDNSLRDTVTGTVGGGALGNIALGNNATLTGTLGETTYDEIVLTNVAAEVGPLASALAATAVVSPPAGTPPFTLTLTITATGGSGAYSYQVTNWGDGTTSPPQSSPIFSKAIPAGVSPGAKSVAWSVTG